MFDKDNIYGVRKAGKKVVGFSYTLEKDVPDDCGNMSKIFIEMVFSVRARNFWNVIAYIPTDIGRKLVTVDTTVRFSIKDNIDFEEVEKMVYEAERRIKFKLSKVYSYFCGGSNE